MAAPAVAPYASASLYVGDLSKDVTETVIFEIFNAVGPVASVRICRDAATRRSLGYAYVNFHRVEDAERALDSLNFKNIRNVPCRIMWSHRDPSLRKSGVGNVFVKNLAPHIENKALYDTFSMFGNILSCKVATDDNSKSLGYGFVHYETEEAAQKAIAQVDGKLIEGMKVVVAPFKPKSQRSGEKTNIYVKNIPADWTQEKFEGFFAKVGEIKKVALALPDEKDKSKKHRGFGFVNYAKAEDAKKAIEKFHDHQLDEKTKLYVAHHQNKKERERELRLRRDQRRIDRQKQMQGVNLYVKNLVETIDDKRLNAEFAKFGNITSAKVMSDQGGKSKGFGFVCFSLNEEATRALQEMNNRMLEGKPLYVGWAQPKDARRAELEARYQARISGGYPGPMMYQGPAGPHMIYPGPRVMYPQMRPLGYPPQNAPGPQMMVQQPVNYQLLPMNNRQGGAPVSQRGGRGGFNQRRGGGQQRGGGPPPQQPYPEQALPGAGVRYSQNVRNANPPARAAPAAAAPPNARAPAPAPAVPAATGGSLTIKALAAAPEEQKKEMIGERLFPLVRQIQPELAPKITGMLLEMDNGELIHLLESREALKEKVKEAVQVLEDGGDEEEEGEEAEEAEE